MDTRIVALLKSTDPNKRKQGIKALVQSGDPDAKRYLAALYKRETDDSVRQMVVRAAEYIKEQEAALAYEDDFSMFDDPEPVTADDFASFNAPDDEYANTASMFDKPKREAKAKLDDECTATFGAAMLDVTIYGLLQGAIVFVGVLIGMGYVQNLLNVFAYTADPMMAAEFNQFFSSLGIGIGIAYGIASMIGAIFGMLLGMGVIHMVAGMLGGKGTYPCLLRRVVLPSSVLLIASTVMGGLAFVVIMNAIPTDPAVWENEYMMARQLQDVGSTLNLFQSLNLLISFAGLFWFGHIIGKNYRFGMGQGCLTMFISSMAFVVVACGCMFVLMSTIFSSASMAY